MDPAIYIPLGAFAMIAFIVHQLSRAATSRSQHRLEAHSKMLDRFGSSSEFVNFLHTAEGRRYLATVSSGAKKSQKEKVLGSVRIGIILVVLSAGLIAISFLIGFERPLEEPPFVIGFLGMFLGVGFLGSAAVSFWLARSWGMEDASVEQRS